MDRAFCKRIHLPLMQPPPVDFAARVHQLESTQARFSKRTADECFVWPGADYHDRVYQPLRISRPCRRAVSGGGPAKAAYFGNGAARTKRSGAGGPGAAHPGPRQSPVVLSPLNAISRCISSSQKKVYRGPGTLGGSQGITMMRPCAADAQNDHRRIIE
jgi:hypothetical protein